MSLEQWPVPMMKKLPIYRSHVFRIVWLLILAFISVLVYQVNLLFSDYLPHILTAVLSQGTNVALYSLTAAIGYTRAQMKGEIMEEAKENRGATGKA